MAKKKKEDPRKHGGGSVEFNLGICYPNHTNTIAVEMMIVPHPQVSRSVDPLSTLSFSTNSAEPILIFGRTTTRHTLIFLLVPFPF